MTTKEWIFLKFKKGITKNNLKKKSYYNMFMVDSKSTSSYKSYKESVSRAYTSFIEKENIKDIAHLSPLEESDIIKLIEDFIEKYNSKPTYEDIVNMSTKRGFNPQQFFRNNDITSIINNIYKMKGLHLEEKMSKEKFQNEIKILKKENKELSKKSLNLDNLVSLFDSVVKEYSPLEFSGINSKKEIGKREAILLLSDIHWGEKVNSEETMGLAVYSVDIAIKRIDMLFDRVVHNISEYNTNEITIMLLGDFVDGVIQPDSLRNTDIHIVDGLITLADYLSKKITELTKFFKKIKINSVVGNHGRILYQESSI